MAPRQEYLGRLGTSLRHEGCVAIPCMGYLVSSAIPRLRHGLGFTGLAYASTKYPRQSKFALMRRATFTSPSFQLLPSLHQVLLGACMTLFSWRSIRVYVACLVAANMVSNSSALLAQGGSPERWVRVVWQDRSDKSLRWGEFVKVGPQMTFKNGGKVKDFPVLDAEHTELVQMERVENALLVGVRDDNQGGTKSGWVGVDLQVIEEPHGDHSDYTYGEQPIVVSEKLDDQQGNPAHLYVYDREFYLANDRLNGFTRISPKELIKTDGEPKTTFYRGGGAHITLAATGGKVAYSTWIGRGPEGGGNIEVVNLGKPGEDSIAYSLNSASGGLHGAIANSGKVFFAPSDGVEWVEADLTVSKKPEEVKINHIPLGINPDNERPYRTGAFAQCKDWIIFTTGRGDDAGLGLVRASDETPKLVKLPIPTQEGLSLVVPEIVTAASGKRYAFVFQNRPTGDLQEKLTLVDLDPNGDNDFSDAVVIKNIDVGSSKLDGHYGHHSVGFDDDARYAVFSVPGDGELVLFSLDTLKVISKHKVGGEPTKVIAIGGEESKH